MGRAALWNAIHDTLRNEIADGHYAPGDRLPTEAQMASRFQVNRHTVRRALSALSEQDIVYARRGAGVFVRHVPTPYPIGRRVRFNHALHAAGRVPTRRILSLETRLGNTHELAALHLTENAMVHVYEGLSLSDGVPLAITSSAFPAARFPDLPEVLRESKSITTVFAHHNIKDYTRQSTQITAKAASRTKAALLELRPGDPILRTISINVDAADTPIEYGRTWFAADRVTLNFTPDG